MKNGDESFRMRLKSFCWIYGMGRT
jgi:hypothetical protein